MFNSSNGSHQRHHDVVITSFGYRHGNPEAATITLDVRGPFNKPSTDPRFREWTGLDPQVREHVLTNAGAEGLVDGVAYAVTALIAPSGRDGQPVRVAVGCGNGRHISVVVAEEIGVLLKKAGWDVVVDHRDVGCGSVVDYSGASVAVR